MTVTGWSGTTGADQSRMNGAGVAVSDRVHPAADIFPAMGEAEYASLRADIEANGLHEPLWLHGGRVLDGRHRLRACEELGIAPTTREYTGNDPAAFVVSLNLHRRHLDTSQRALVAARLATLPRGTNQHSPNGEPSQAAAAELLNVGKRSVERARTVLDTGAPELVAAVERGDMAVSAAAEIAELPPAEQVEAINRPHVANNSGENEWYTPPEYIAAAREVMGGIDCDPASSAIANRTVGATAFYDKEQDGLKQTWQGCVFLNPPYAQPLIAQFAEAVAQKFETGEIEQACVLVNNATETAWFQRMLEAAQVVCFVRTRVRFLDRQGNPSGAPLQGQAMLYFGTRQLEFLKAFHGLGVVLVHP